VRAMVRLRECGDEGGGADRLCRGVAWWGEWMSAQTNARRWIDRIDGAGDAYATGGPHVYGGE
jgi:hypothetical protein